MGSQVTARAHRLCSSPRSRARAPPGTVRSARLTGADSASSSGASIVTSRCTRVSSSAVRSGQNPATASAATAPTALAVRRTGQRSPLRCSRDSAAR